jgi:plasmid stabilization system protein ParE
MPWATKQFGTSPPFSIIYRVETDRVLIVAVAHERRRPGYWKSS